MAEGFSYESFGAVINVNRDTLFEWEKKHPEWAHAKSIAELKSLYKWEKIGKAGLGVKGFSAAVWIYSMKCRFGKYGWNPKATDANDPGDDFEFI